jgi:hypothetical protein
MARIVDGEFQCCGCIGNSMAIGEWSKRINDRRSVRRRFARGRRFERVGNVATERRVPQGL